MAHLAPVVYLPHGGGPMPLLQDPAHASLTAFLKALPQRIATPRAILLISAHWEEDEPSVYADEKPGMLFDYHGFPPSAYRFNYPAPGDPALGLRIAELLQSAGWNPQRVQGRGYDHGAFVPLLLMYPEANIPCLQLSLVTGLDPAEHLRLGAALQTLREDGVLILGSGMSFHNMRAIMSRNNPDYERASEEFASWLKHTMSSEKVNSGERTQQLEQWVKAPYGTFCHPRPEHFMPLHVCAGAAGAAQAEVLFDEPLMGHRVNGFGWF